MTPLELRRRRRARTSCDLWKRQTSADSRLGIAHEKYIAVMAITAYSQFNQEKEMLQTYIGTKVIKALPMTRELYNAYRGWQLPADENGEDMGYLVEYVDGGKSNHPDHAGYISWSPSDVFDRSYRAVDVGVSFGDALQMLKAGKKVARTGWNGKGMFVYLVQGSTFAVNRPPLLGIYAEGTTINYNAHIDIKGADGSVSTWVPSIGDCLATDWQVVE